MNDRTRLATLLIDNKLSTPAKAMVAMLEGFDYPSYPHPRTPAELIDCVLVLNTIPSYRKKLPDAVADAVMERIHANGGGDKWMTFIGVLPQLELIVKAEQGTDFPSTNELLRRLKL